MRRRWRSDRTRRRVRDHAAETAGEVALHAVVEGGWRLLVLPFRLVGRALRSALDGLG